MNDRKRLHIGGHWGGVARQLDFKIDSRFGGAGLENIDRDNIAAVPRDGLDPDTMDWGGRIGIVLGGEGPGLPDAVIARCSARVTIPMAPRVESLNVAVAGAILVYAARRARLAAST